MNFKIPDPHVQVWDYIFSQESADLVYMAGPKGGAGNCATYSPNMAWRYLLIGDSPDVLKEDIVKVLKEEGEQHKHDQVLDELEFVQVDVKTVLDSWRFIRYNGTNLCAMECADFTPTNASAYPLGPIAPVRNAWVYTAYDRKTDEPLGWSVKDSGLVLPYCCRSVVHFVSHANEMGIEPEVLFEKHHIVASNVLNLAMEHPVVMWGGKPFPLYEVLNLNPNHVGDPEEQLLSSAL